MEKIYKVDFMKYTNVFKDTVSNQAKEIKDEKYLRIGNEPFLVRESEFDNYRARGGGFRYIEFVGNIAEEDIRKKYVGCMVSDLFPKGNQNPIKYIFQGEVEE